MEWSFYTIRESTLNNRRMYHLSPINNPDELVILPKGVMYNHSRVNPTDRAILTANGIVTGLANGPRQPVGFFSFNLIYCFFTVFQRDVLLQKGQFTLEELKKRQEAVLVEVKSLSEKVNLLKENASKR